MAVSFSDDVHGTVAFLEPKGISVIPKTIREVLDAIGCILDALNVRWCTLRIQRLVIFFTGYASRAGMYIPSRHQMAKCY